jgi:hypothetical protein
MENLQQSGIHHQGLRISHQFGQDGTPASGEGVTEMREYVEAMLGLEVYSHKLYECAHSEPHGEGTHHHEHAA